MTRSGIILLFLHFASQLLMLDSIDIRNSPGRGRGVFTRKDIYAGTVIETSPILLLTEEERNTLKPTLLARYLFEIPSAVSKTFCLALGYSSMYNHSYTANCMLKTRLEDHIIVVIAIRTIQRDEELFVNYNGSPADTTPVYFNNGKEAAQ